jgi:DNA repair exonuclease SbcCD nuclease subunit
MTKLLFFTDVHATGIFVNHRKDVYINSIIEKLIWIKNYALCFNYDAVLFGGDLFHVPEPSTSIVNSIL